MKEQLSNNYDPNEFRQKRKQFKKKLEKTAPEQRYQEPSNLERRAMGSNISREELEDFKKLSQADIPTKEAPTLSKKPANVPDEQIPTLNEIIPAPIPAEKKKLLMDIEGETFIALEKRLPEIAEKIKKGINLSYTDFQIIQNNFEEMEVPGFPAIAPEKNISESEDAPKEENGKELLMDIEGDVFGKLEKELPKIAQKIKDGIDLTDEEYELIQDDLVKETVDEAPKAEERVGPSGEKQVENILDEYYETSTGEKMPERRSDTSDREARKQLLEKNQETAENAREKGKELERILYEDIEREAVIIEREAEKKGYKEAIKNWTSEGVQAYRKMPLTKKLLISFGLLGVGTGLGLAAGATAGAMATAAFLGSLPFRIMGGAGAYVALDEALEKNWEKTQGGAERKGWRKGIHKGEAALLGILLGGALPTAVGNIVDFFSPDVIVDNSPAEKKNMGGAIRRGPDIIGGTAHASMGPSGVNADIARILAGIDAGASAGDAAHAPLASAEIPNITDTLNAKSWGVPHEVIKGDTVWSILERQLQEQGRFSNLSEGQKLYIIDSLENKLSGLSYEQLQDELGISSGNIHRLRIGDTIDFSSLLQEKDVLSSVTEARDLPTEAIQSIEKNTGVVYANPVERIDTVSEEIVEGLDVTTEAITRTSNIIRNDLTELFGSKGLFGVGFLGSSGENTLEWEDFKNRTVSEVINKQEFAPGDEFDDSASDSDRIGIDSPEDTEKMTGYIKNITTATGISHDDGETVQNFLQRAITTDVASKIP